MKEPAIHLAAATLAGGASASIGAVIGIPLEALIAGLFGGLVAVFVLPIEHKGRRPPKGLALYAALVGSVFASVAFAGFVGPFVAALIDLPNVPNHFELLAMSFICGAGAQAGLLVKFIGALGNRIDQIGGNTP